MSQWTVCKQCRKIEIKNPKKTCAFNTFKKIEEQVYDESKNEKNGNYYKASDLNL